MTKVSENHSESRLFSKSGGPLRILIVDDDVQFSTFLLEYFSMLEAPVEVTAAHNGLVAGRMMYEFEPQVVLLDLKMPGMDGQQVCRQLKTAHTTKDIRVIAMSGFFSRDDQRRILDAGAEVCLLKPFTPDVLLNAIGLKP